MIERFIPRIEIEVFRDRFVFRNGRQERVVPTRGYIKREKNHPRSYVFDEQPVSNEHRQISLFDSLPGDLQPDVVEILTSFLMCGIRPLCTGPIGSWMRPVIVFTGVERFATGFGFEYAAFRAAAGHLAFDDGKAVHFEKSTRAE
jgi:hypothetical protein